MLPMMLRERTVSPRTTPRCWVTRYPVTSLVVVTIMKAPWHQVSSPAKAGDPVFTSVSLQPHRCGILGPPLSRGTTVCVLLDDAGDNSGTNRAAALADGEAKFLLHRDRHDQGDLHRDVVARHHHLGAGRQGDDAGHVGGAEIELR